MTNKQTTEPLQKHFFIIVLNKSELFSACQFYNNLITIQEISLSLENRNCSIGIKKCRRDI